MDLEFTVDAAAQHRMKEYFDLIGNVLNNKKRRASFATYAFGLLAEGARKSVEPIAARACGDPDETDALHQRLLHFLVDSTWSDHAVRREASNYAIEALEKREHVKSWIIDDTGWLKQGRHSVGVQRQYTGSAGKIANCQLGVSLTIATPTEQLPIDFELYLPRRWAEDSARRKEARIPDSVVFKTKIELAREMVRRAVQSNVPRGTVLADCFYGDEPSFRNEVRSLGLDYAVGVKSDNRVWRADKWGYQRGKPLTVKQLASTMGRKTFRRVTWREGIKGKLSARFAMRRVIPAYRKKGEDPSTREAVWLVIEWPDDEREPTNYYFATLPTDITKKRLVRIIKDRWRTERVYQDLKGELGLDHYEGRRFPGWHHHVSIVLCCYAFLIAERARCFPPSARRQESHHSLAVAA